MNGSKLPLDLFVEFEPRDANSIMINNKVVHKSVKDGFLQVDFKLGKADNPKVNAIMLFDGKADEVTNHNQYQAFRKFLVDLQDEQKAEREKAEALFREDAYDFEDGIDGRGPINSFLSNDYALEGCTMLSLLVILSILPK